MKGQIFILDALLAMLLVTVIFGMILLGFERVYSKTNDLQYSELQMLADDWSQIAVKRTLLASTYSGEITANLAALNSSMSSVLKQPYSYEVILSGTGSVKSGQGCSGRNNTASTVRLVRVSGAQQNLTVKICG